MKIMYVITSISLGGAETQLMRLVCNLAKKKKHEIFVVSLIDSTYKLFEDTLKKDNIKYISLQMKRGKISLSGWYHFIKLVHKYKPDVVHSHMIHANFLCRFSKLFVKIPKLINTIHGEEELLGKRKNIYRLTDGLSDITTCIGNVIANQAITTKAVSNKKLLVVYNALNINNYKFSKTNRQFFRKLFGIEENEFTWIIVGRLDKVKNHMNLINAMEILSSKNYNPYLLIVGDGEKREELEKKITNSINLKQRVKFLGFRNDVDTILSTADACVLSSVHEGLPLVLQEAASVGLPLVATDVGGCNEVVFEGQNGYLVPKKEPEKLAHAMIKIMNLSKEERKEYGKFGIEYVRQNFDIESIMDKWLELYENY